MYDININANSSINCKLTGVKFHTILLLKKCGTPGPVGGCGGFRADSYNGATLITERGTTINAGNKQKTDYNIKHCQHNSLLLMNVFWQHHVRE